MIHSCWSRYWIYFILFSVFGFFLILHVTFETVIERRLEPLFPINETLDIVHVKLDSNRSSFRPHFKENTQFSKLLGSSEKTRNLSINLKNCSEILLKLHGKVTLIKEAASSFQALRDELQHSGLQEDGRYQPPNCIPEYRIAIIIPYRDRFKHLNILLRNLHPFLQRQLLDYTIFVVEQAGNGPFNRGMLMNIGFVEAMNIRPFDCFIFHDVDLLPENDRNLYSCTDQPRHMSVAVDVFKYKLPYVEIFGGVSAMLTKHFQLVNGFSNLFWGWGGEDDDMSMRIKMKGLHVVRYPATVARYTMLSHEKAMTNPQRYEKLYYGRKIFKTEGLNSLEYQRIAFRSCKLFTWVFVELQTPSKNESFLDFFKKSYLRGWTNF